MCCTNYLINLASRLTRNHLQTNSYLLCMYIYIYIYIYIYRNQDALAYSGELQFTLSTKDSNCDGKYSFEYCLSLGRHTVKGICMGKKDGQQMAAQALLKVCF